jgi:hypothetical protein
MVTSEITQTFTFNLLFCVARFRAHFQYATALTAAFRHIISRHSLMHLDEGRGLTELRITPDRPSAAKAALQ